MKLHSDITINKKTYPKGTDVPWYMIYPFFLVHMLVFGVVGFIMAYSKMGVSLDFLYMHGGGAVLVYTVFYAMIFGRDAIVWMFINAALGVVGICTQIGWLLSLFGADFHDYPLRVHVVPFMYFVLYTFLLRQAVLDLTRAREDTRKQKRVGYGYMTVLTAIYVVSYLLTRK